MVRRSNRPSPGVPRAAFVLAAAFVGVVPFVEAGKRLPEVPLVLSFGTAPDLILSDGAGYTDGVDNVRAFLFPSGNLSFTTRANTAMTATRTVYFGLGSPVDQDGAPFPGGVDGYSPL